MTVTELDLVSVLLVEDDEDDYLITREMLAGQDRARFSLDWCRSFDDALATMGRQKHDVYLVDYRLGGRNGIDLVREAFAARPSVPVILLTGENDYRIDIEASASGITDFLLKQELNPWSLERAIRYSLAQHQALQRLAMSEERYALAARAANDGIWDWDMRSGQVYYSPRWRSLLGLGDEEVDGTPAAWFDLVHPEDLPGLTLAIDAHLSGRTSLLQFKHRMRRADGSWRWMLVRGIAVAEPGSDETRMAGSLSDITNSRRAEHRLQHDALHDSLTGLPNRALFMDRLERAILRHRRGQDTTCVVLFLDVDRFKLVNDTFSHSVGDRLLVALATRIGKQLRPGDTLARLAGDEFTILVEDLPTTTAGGLAVELAGRIHRALDEEFDIEGNRFFVSGSTGIAVADAEGSAADLLRNADIAMYEAKHRGRDHYAIFDGSMHRRVADRLSREHDLRVVIEKGLIEVHFQPVADLATGRISGFEALARWPREMGPVSPAEFIPVAEETGMISDLGRQVLDHALSALAQWRVRGLAGDDVGMSVNVSGRQLDDPHFPDEVLDSIAAASLPARCLHLEITEGTMMREPERMSRIVSVLCTAGVGLELDDFGTGYSSLAALHSYPVSALKIDRSFVSALLTDGDALVRSTLALSHGLGLRVVAEGIEETDQLVQLRDLGCEYGQGFLLSRPLPKDEIESLLREWRPERVVGPV